MIGRRVLSLVAAVLIVPAFAACSGAEAGKLSWKLGETHPAEYPTTKADKWFADELRERSKGRIDIQVFPSAQLGEERDVLEQVQLGAVEMTRVSAGPMSEFVKEWSVFSLPYLFDDAEHLWSFLDGEYGTKMLEGLREGGYVGLAYYDSGARNFYTKGKPVRSPADLKGQKIRVMPGAANADMVEAMGGSPVTMDFGEVYGALETGVIDGAENNQPSYMSAGHNEIAKNFTRDGHQRIPEILLLNAGTWDKLTEADRTLIKGVAKESIAEQRKMWDAAVKKAEGEMKKSGSKIIDVDSAAFQGSVRELLNTYRTRYPAMFKAIEAARAG